MLGRGNPRWHEGPPPPRPAHAARRPGPMGRSRRHVRHDPLPGRGRQDPRDGAEHHPGRGRQAGHPRRVSPPVPRGAHRQAQSGDALGLRPRSSCSTPPTTWSTGSRSPRSTRRFARASEDRRLRRLVPVPAWRHRSPAPLPPAPSRPREHRRNDPDARRAPLPSRRCVRVPARLAAGSRTALQHAPSSALGRRGRSRRRASMTRRPSWSSDTPRGVSYSFAAERAARRPPGLQSSIERADTGRVRQRRHPAG